ncbi:MAG TPA: hypothetical protein VFR84_02705 [Candidatus Angelobacter sp.]|nr:hypothetical protein [Candidatus Angelobacter sp.]
MAASAPSPPVKAEPSYRSLDVAYGCFAFIAFALCFGPLLWILPLSEGDREGYGMLLGVPIMFGAFLAGLMGLVLAIVHRSHWQLAAMAVAGVLFLLTWAGPEDAMEFAAVCYAVLIVSFCVTWFFFLRRKMKRAEREDRTSSLF